MLNRKIPKVHLIFIHVEINRVSAKSTQTHYIVTKSQGAKFWKLPLVFFTQNIHI